MKTFRTLRISLIVAIAALATVSSSFAGQPNMRAALENLRAARAELLQASHNKGGWRVDALHHLDAVIAEVENGIAAGHH